MATNPNETISKANGSTADFKNRMHATEDGLEKFSYNAGQKIGHVASDIASSTSEYVKSGRDYVKENPVKGVALAAAVGAVAGSIVTLLMRRKD